MPKEDKLEGSREYYQIAASIKKYTLRDNGFIETKNSNFQFLRDLEVGNPNSTKLKVTIDKELRTVKLTAVTANGLRSVNLYKNEHLKEARERANYILASFVEANILEKK